MWINGCGETLRTVPKKAGGKGPDDKETSLVASSQAASLLVEAKQQALLGAIVENPIEIHDRKRRNCSDDSFN